MERYTNCYKVFYDQVVMLVDKDLSILPYQDSYLVDDQEKLVKEFILCSEKILSEKTLDRRHKQNDPKTRVNLIMKFFRLRNFSYIPPDSKATVKSLTNNFKNKRIISETETEVMIITNFTAVFKEFIDSIECLSKIEAFAKSISEMSVKNDSIQNQCFQLWKHVKMIGMMNVHPHEKIHKITLVLTSITNPKEIFQYLIKTYITLKEDLSVNFDVEPSHIEVICQVIKNLRKVEHSYLTQLYGNNKYRGIYNRFFSELARLSEWNFLSSDNLQNELILLLETFIITFDDNIVQKVKASLKVFVTELKSNVTIDIAGKTLKFKDGANKDLVTLLTDIINNKEVSPKDYIEKFTDSNMIKGSQDIKDAFYKRLRLHNVHWDDKYLTGFFEETMGLLEGC